MLKNISFIFLLLFILTGSNQAQNNQPQQTFTLGNQTFLLNNKPFLIRAAELHYPRIPREYWEHRIKMCKAMGMNTICMYLFWNLHEQQPGTFDFTGQNDIAAFVKLVQKNGMYCIVRPGPYVCAEWDMGGLPWWLLKKNDLKVRSKDDPFFMQSVKRYLNEAVKILAPYQIQNGGNIIMAQVENEYGVWGKDATYMTQIRDMLRSAGFDKVQLFRCDWSSNFDNYQVADVASTLNFGAGANIEQQFKKFRELNPTAPLMCSEYWTGWFDAWGNPHQTRSVASFIGSLKDMLDKKISFSLYMAHGGSSFGQWAGANAPPYAPDVSSYDYNAPIDEGGNATEKFYAIRDLLKNYLNEGEKLAAVPPMPAKTITLPAIQFTETAGLFDNLPPAKKSVNIQPMEYFDQGWGRILYRTTLSPSDVKRKLIITDVHDFALVYLNRELVGKLDRRVKGRELVIPPTSGSTQLDLLIETEGRVNYGEAIIDRKGITQKVELEDAKGKKEIRDWLVYNIPVDYTFQKNKHYKSVSAKGPTWYRATFNLRETGDTYLDMTGWNKGMVWVNGYSLGRFWHIGPVQTLYLPGAWLKKGRNEIILIDLEEHKTNTVAGIVTPILDRIILDESLLHKKAGQQLDLQHAMPIYSGEISPGTDWKTFELNKPFKGRYFCLEAISPKTPGDSVASIAEISLTGEDGKAISTINWTLVYADSENLPASQTADRVFDNQESVIWQTATGKNKTPYPHQVVIDLGSEVRINGFKILPRADNSKQGFIKKFRIFLQPEPFKL